MMIRTTLAFGLALTAGAAQAENPGTLGAVVGGLFGTGDPGPQQDAGGGGGVLSILSRAGGQMNSMGGGQQAEPRQAAPGQTRADLKRLVGEEFYGYHIDHPAIALPGDGIGHLGDVVSGAPAGSLDEVPEEIARLDVAARCAPTPPDPGAALASVQVAWPDEPSAVAAFDNDLLAERTLGWAKAKMRGSRKAGDRPDGDIEALPTVNVVLTDTSAPQHLVLQTAAPGVLWNLQPAPGVDLVHVTLVGPGIQAIHRVDGTYSVEVVSVGEDCAPLPARAIAPHWDMFDRLPPNSRDLERYAAEAQARFDAYEAWFTAAFGRSVEDVTIGAWTASGVLVGPAPTSPDDRPVWRPHGRVEVTQSDHLIAGTDQARTAAIADLQHDLMRAATAGDLTALMPPAMEITE